jgi:hypothetical protein
VQLIGKKKHALRITITTSYLFFLNVSFLVLLLKLWRADLVSNISLMQYKFIINVKKIDYILHCSITSNIYLTFSVLERHRLVMLDYYKTGLY